MSRTQDGKSERLHLRLDPIAKGRIERAAGHCGQSLSQFVLSRSIDAADQVIRKHETMVLSERDWATFMDAILDPPEPNARLREAMARHRETVRSR